MVRVTHPQAEADPPTVTTPPPVNGGESESVGSGLLQLMAQDGTEPALSASLWVGGPPAEAELCFAKTGVLYYWLMSEGRGFRLKPT
jgi:hypothetical protein